MEICVGKLGARTEMIVLRSGAVVEDAIEEYEKKVGMQPEENLNIRLNGEEVELDELLRDGDSIVLTHKAKAGC